MSSESFQSSSESFQPPLAESAKERALLKSKIMRMREQIQIQLVAAFEGEGFTNNNEHDIALMHKWAADNYAREFAEVFAALDPAQLLEEYEKDVSAVVEKVRGLLSQRHAHA